MMWMRIFGFRRKPKGSQGQWWLHGKLFIQPNNLLGLYSADSVGRWGAVRQLEQALQRMPDRWNTGTELDVKVPMTHYESVKGDMDDRVQLPEEVAAIHELLCGEPLEYLPKWVFQEVNVPGGWYCKKCNHLFVPGFQETYYKETQNQPRTGVD